MSGARFAAGKRALGICDFCGRTFKLRELRDVYRKDRNTHLKACKVDWDASHPQLRLGDYPVHDPQALRDPRPDPYVAANTARHTLLTGPSSGDSYKSPYKAWSRDTDGWSLILRLAATDWTPTSQENWFSIWNETGNNRVIAVQLQTAGQLRTYISPNGSGNVWFQPSTQGWTDATYVWVKIVQDYSAGATVYASTEDTTVLGDVTFSSIGAFPTINSTYIPYEGVANFVIGNLDTNNTGSTGKVQRAIFYDSPDQSTTPIMDFDPVNQQTGATYFTVQRAPFNEWRPLGGATIAEDS